MAYRSTTVQMAARHCPAALDFYDARAPYSREHFQGGVAAHAVLEHLGRHAVPADRWQDEADRVVRGLVTEGRAFDGLPEPPMSPESAIAGRDVALSWLRDRGGSFPAGAQFELGLGLTVDGAACAYGPDAWYVAVLDVLFEEEEGDGEEWSARTIVVRDYKTAWDANQEDVGTLQMKGQALLALAHHPGFDAVRREIVNLRTGKVYAETTYLDGDGMDTVRRWRMDIAHAVSHADTRNPDGKRPARPGANCMGCAYLARCQPAQATLGTLADAPEEMAVELAVLEARRAAVIASLKAACAEGPISIPGGVVGFAPKSERVVRDGAVVVLAHRWFEVGDAETWDREHGQFLGLLQALRPGVTNMDAAVKALHPFDRADKAGGWKERRAALEAELLTLETVARFGVHKETP
jgi:hypothetical protein